jgi:hypothetical protein
MISELRRGLRHGGAVRVRERGVRAGFNDELAEPGLAEERDAARGPDGRVEGLREIEEREERAHQVDRVRHALGTRGAGRLEVTTTGDRSRQNVAVHTPRYRLDLVPGAQACDVCAHGAFGVRSSEVRDPRADEKR